MSNSGQFSFRKHVAPQPSGNIGKSERTRAAILNAALGIIWSHPFRDMTVGSLMAETGLSRSAFYQYFDDLHDLMKTLLDNLQVDIFDVTGAWFEGVGDPIALLDESLSGLVTVCYKFGPILRAVDAAAATDERFEKDWRRFLGKFDDAVTSRIEADQQQDLIPGFDARPIAIALNQLDAYTLINAFGQRPRKNPKPVNEALSRIWIASLYGSEWLEKGSSNLVRK